MEVQKAGAPSQLEAVQQLRSKVTDLINQAKSGNVQKLDMATLDGWLDQAAVDVMGGTAKKGDFNGVNFASMTKTTFDPMEAMQKLQTIDRQLATVEMKLENSKGGGAEQVDSKQLQNWLDDALLETVSVPGFEGRSETLPANWMNEDNVVPLNSNPGDAICRVLPSTVQGIDLPPDGDMTVKATPQGTYLETKAGDKFFVPPGRDLPVITRGGQPYTPIQAQ